MNAVLQPDPKRPPLAALQARFPASIWWRGRRYAEAGRVRLVETREHDDGWLLRAEVRGSRRAAYRVDVWIGIAPRRLELDSQCTCPVGRQCKHAAASLWAWREGNAGVPHPQEDRSDLAGARGAGLCFVFDRTDDGNERAVLIRALWAEREPQGLGRAIELAPQREAGPETLPLGPAEREALRSVSEGPCRKRRGTVWRVLERTYGGWLEQQLDRGRLYRVGNFEAPLRRGPERPLALHWTIESDGRQRLQAVVDGAAEWLDLDPPLYFDAAQARIGRLQLPAPADELRRLLVQPPLTPEAAAERAARPQPFLPSPQLLLVQSEPGSRPPPALVLATLADREALVQQGRRRRIGVARYGYRMLGRFVPADQALAGVRRYERGAVIERAVDPLWHAEQLAVLAALGALPARQADLDVEAAAAADVVLNPARDEESLQEFCFVAVPELRRRGWQIDYAANFPVQLIDLEPRWYAQATASERSDWFSFQLGVEVDGERIDLLPVIAQMLRQGSLPPLPAHPEARVGLTLPSGRRLPIAAGRLRAILAALTELGPGPASARLELPRVRAAVLAELEHALKLELDASDPLRTLAARLAEFRGLAPIDPPPGFRGSLRGYQREGLAWLQFLAEHGLAGILADDMGLGKTVQVLAHIERERALGRLDRPVLIVAPTSVLPNWRQEIARFTPALALVELTGQQRAARFAQIQGQPLILTSYALLARDVVKLRRLAYHLLVLDEAQMVKNPSSQAARAARLLHARHKLCLTGTPLENHLGELWAQFDFLLPGLLGTRSHFQRLFRIPIERRRDSASAERLRRRIAPFLLRRSKDQVVAELPPKSVIDTQVALDGGQRDLYEALRVRLAGDVRLALAERGAERSRVLVLDALLKLRQVCCDPRLLDLDAARSAPSAKLERLLAMLEQLIAAGRRILVFSQFARMLELIAERLRDARLPYLLLTGSTEDRAEPVSRFQRLEVPIFLISLRAGGFGLNLTAADTVIHYDPWWNPAVEAQATDRAYRIGQDKPVFVYRLIAAGTVEQRVQELQARKRDLAEALYGALERGSERPLQADDLLALFEPLEPPGRDR